MYEYIRLLQLHMGDDVTITAVRVPYRIWKVEGGCRAVKTASTCSVDGGPIRATTADKSGACVIGCVGSIASTVQHSTAL